MLERFPALLVADEVHAWLARGGHAAGSAASARRGSTAAGAFALETISGELPEELGARDGARRPRSGSRSPRQAAEALLELRGARLDKRALRCATRLQVGQEPAPATLSLVDSVGEPRFTLDVNWDPDTIPAFLALPACEAHGRSLPLDPYLVEPLEHYLRTYGVEVGGAAQERLDRAARRARRRDRRRPPLARARRAAPSAAEERLGGELRPFQRAGVAYVLRARRTFLADEQGLGKTVQALAALEADDACPAVVDLPGEPQAQLAARGASAGCRTARVAVVSGTGSGGAEPPT